VKLFPIKIFLVFILISFHSDIYSQNSFFKNILHDFCITPSFNYVSSASILLNPYNSDLIEKNSTAELSGGYGYGVTVKKRIFGDDIYLGVSTEYIKIKDDQLTTTLDNDEAYEKVWVTETLEMIPIELSLYFNIPQFVDNFNVYLGGGAGIYFGNRTRKMVGMETTTLSKTPMFSLIVLFGMEYFVSNNMSLNLEMKVREGKFRVKNHFPTDNVTLDGETYYFDQDFESKIYVDGLKVSFGLGYYF
jgi:hypothetical protein